ncbi:putative acyltransferase [Yersinia nurmii]|uniref:Acyltransferase n=1 Tax=Yersinia nurmii TaxID=685706 RepID=A0ABP1Y673_9GAMM|nr:lysophospholipid acyltransferase family protein [Yersinia nurmii]CND82612.1 putative acyltransferase [Yersinia nurmii]
MKVLKLGRQINWLWRLVMTGLCFALFGLGGLLLSLLWFNFLLLTQRDGQQRRILARRSISASFRLFLALARRLGVLDYRLQGIEKIRADKGCLVVANHPTLLDYVILASALPDVDCLVKAGLLRNPFVNGVIKAADYLVNSQGPTLLAACRQRLNRGENILIFPEGTRTSPGKPLKLQRGAANVAVRCECDLRIVHIHCSQQTLDKQSRWYQIPPEKPVFSVVVGERIANEYFVAVEEDAQALAARQLNRQLAQLLTPEKGQPMDTDDARTLS